MITKEEAINPANIYFHEGQCKRIIGPRGGITTRVTVWRRNGQTKTWKTRPNEFRIPVKHGFYSYGYINELNAGEFHLESDCNLLKESENETFPSNSSDES